MYLLQPAPENKPQTTERGESDPARLARIYQSSRPALLIPALQGFITGLAAGVAFGALIWLAEIYELIPSRAWAPAIWGFVFFTLVQAGAVFSGFHRWAQSLRGLEHMIERVTGADLNGDNKIGDDPIDDEPQEKSFKIEMTQRSDGGVKQTQLFTLPTTPEKFTDLARGLVHGQAFSERRWSGSGALFSQAEFRTLRDEMIRRGLLRWIDERYPNQGVEITRPGRAVIEHFAGAKFEAAREAQISAPSPTPPRA